ncbi:hypothetical protein [Rhodococcus sp. NPDC004095]
MNPIVREAVSVLEQGGVELAPGLTDAEMDAVRERFGFDFGPDHRGLLSAVLPMGDRWPDWRDGDEAELRRMLDWPIAGFVFDAVEQDPPFWPTSWGVRPTDAHAIERVVRARLAQWPLLVPVYGHRYTPAAPAPSGAPVFSVYQTDIIYYGPDLVGYLRSELGIGAVPRSDWTLAVTVPHWSRFVESGNSAESI